jgi:hypothetical protein
VFTIDFRSLNTILHLRLKLFAFYLGRERDLPGPPLHQGRDVRAYSAGHSDQRQGGFHVE